MLDTMETLCCLDGVSGREDEVREYILERVMPFADEIRTDAMGNLMVFKKGAAKPKQHVMLAAHMDVNLLRRLFGGILLYIGIKELL